MSERRFVSDGCNVTLLVVQFKFEVFLVKNQYPAQEALLQALKLALKPA